MKNNHRTKWITRAEFNGAWKLHRLFRNPNVHGVFLKCETCQAASRRKPLTRQKLRWKDGGIIAQDSD